MIALLAICVILAIVIGRLELELEREYQALWHSLPPSLPADDASPLPLEVTPELIEEVRTARRKLESYARLLVSDPHMRMSIEQQDDIDEALQIISRYKEILKNSEVENTAH